MNEGFPKSAFLPTGSLVYFARMLDKFMLKRGWRDEDDGSTQELQGYKEGSGLSGRDDLLTFFDYYEVDEGRRI